MQLHQRYLFAVIPAHTVIRFEIDRLEYSNTPKQLIGGGGAVKGLRDRPFARVSTNCIWSSPAITRNVLQEDSRELRRASTAQITNTTVTDVSNTTTTATVAVKYTFLYRSFWRELFVRSLPERRLCKHVFVWLSEIEGIVSIHAPLTGFFYPPEGEEEVGVVRDVAFRVSRICVL